MNESVSLRELATWLVMLYKWLKSGILSMIEFRKLFSHRVPLGSFDMTPISQTTIHIKTIPKVFINQSGKFVSILFSGNSETNASIPEKRTPITQFRIIINSTIGKTVFNPKKKAFFILHIIFCFLIKIIFFSL